MVQFCCVIGCGNRSNRDYKGFYRLPNVPKKCNKSSYKADIIQQRRKQWLLNIRRADLRDGDAAYSPGYIRVCSDHFVSGKPSTWSDINNVDWAPTLGMGNDYSRVKRKRRVRGKQRRDFDKIGPRGRRRHHKADTERNRAQRAAALKNQKILFKQELLSFALDNSEDQGEEKLTTNPIIHKITVDCIVEHKYSLEQLHKETDCIAVPPRETDCIAVIPRETECIAGPPEETDCIVGPPKETGCIAEPSNETGCIAAAFMEIKTEKRGDNMEQL